MDKERSSEFSSNRGILTAYIYNQKTNTNIVQQKQIFMFLCENTIIHIHYKSLINNENLCLTKQVLFGKLANEGPAIITRNQVIDWLTQKSI